MKFNSELNGIIFDFNGVLLWDDILQRKSWRQFATRFREIPLSDEEINVHVRGRNNQYTLEYLLGKSIDQIEANRLTEQKESIYRQMCLDLGKDFKLSPGAVYLLSDLADHHIPHTIATSSGKTNVDFFIQNLGLETWFEIKKIVYDNGQFPGKPAPDIYWQAACNLNLETFKCAVVEDSQSGIQAAYNAGVGYIMALGPKEQHGILAQFRGVNQVIENLRQVGIRELFLTHQS